MKKVILYLFFVIGNVQAQLPETDIFVCDMKEKGGKYQFSKPENITHRQGYDNQPYFMPDGKSMLFVAVPDTTQADIFSYDFKTKKIAAVTNTKESEYSPMLTADGKNISVVRVNSDNGQRLYKLQAKNTSEVSHINGTDSIGYYCWLNPGSLAMFILGDAMTLQVLDVDKNERMLIASDVGRCMRLTNDQKKLMFVIKQSENEWSIFEMDIATKEKKLLVNTIPGSEDYAVLKDGSLIMGSKGKLYRYDPSSGSDWKEIADFSAELGDFYRISVNAQGDKIAMVAFSGKKP
jgi:Tol biopolymer transport system component